MAKSFEAQLRDFEGRTAKKIAAVVKQSAQDLFEACQTPQPSVKETGGSFEVGKIPVDLGDLRGSFVSGLNGQKVAEGEEAYIATIAGYKLGDSIQGGWTADHARPIEYGSGKIKPRRFVGANVPKWPQFVAANVERAKALGL